MKTAKIIIPAVTVLAFLIILSSCGTLSGVLVKEKSNETTRGSYSQQNSETDEDTSKPENRENSTENEDNDRSTDPEYVKAVKNLYEKNKALQEEIGSEGDVYAYFTDVNGDGYKDIISRYDSLVFPVLDIYKNGEFVTCPIEPEVMGGSLFPSGKESGYFIDAEKGIIVVRYDSHTWGTVMYRGAQAFQIEGTAAKSLWTEYFDETAHDGDKNYIVNSDEDWDQVNELINKEFDEKQYLPRIKGYNLVNFFDVYALWDGSVIEPGTGEKEVSNALKFSNLPKEFWFASGVGGWSEVIRLNADGFFDGSFSDHDYGKLYFCLYSGNFGKPEKRDEYSYTVKIENLKVDNDRNKLNYQGDDNPEFIPSDLYGIENAKELVIYLPGTPLSELTEDCISWLQFKISENDTKTPDNLYVLYNEKEGRAFCGSFDE